MVREVIPREGVERVGGQTVFAARVVQPSRGVIPREGVESDPP
jgi:hypothetical protein